MEHKQPKIAVDIIIEVGDGNPIKIVMIKRKNPPYGWALPGGFVEYGESLENAAFREAEEETNLKVGNCINFILIVTQEETLVVILSQPYSWQYKLTGLRLKQ